VAPWYSAGTQYAAVSAARAQLVRPERSDPKVENAFVYVQDGLGDRVFAIPTTPVEIDQKGFVKVDNRQRTADPHLLAIGDVAGEPMLAHKASHEARATVEGIHGENVIFDPAAIPAVVFTDPEIAWCGLTEDDARKQGRRVEIAKFPWGASGRATTLDRNDGVTKLVIEPGTERVLGVGIAGTGAGDRQFVAAGRLEGAAVASSGLESVGLGVGAGRDQDLVGFAVGGFGRHRFLDISLGFVATRVRAIGTKGGHAEGRRRSRRTSRRSRSRPRACRRPRRP